MVSINLKILAGEAFAASAIVCYRSRADEGKGTNGERVKRRRIRLIRVSSNKTRGELLKMNDLARLVCARKEIKYSGLNVPIFVRKRGLALLIASVLRTIAQILKIPETFLRRERKREKIKIDENPSWILLSSAFEKERERVI